MRSDPLLIYKDTTAAISPNWDEVARIPDYIITKDVQPTNPIHYRTNLTAKAGGFSHITQINKDYHYDLSAEALYLQYSCGKAACHFCLNKVFIMAH